MVMSRSGMSGSSCGHARTGRENAGFPVSNAYYNIQIDCRALDLKSFDVVGFSLGGMIAQQLAFEYPDMIRRMILLGTGPRGGEGMTFTELSVDDLADPVALLMSAFFTSSEASKAAGRAYIERLKLRVADRDAPVSVMAAGAQLEAIREWGAIPSTDRYAMLARIHQRTLIVHGSKDIV